MKLVYPPPADRPPTPHLLRIAELEAENERLRAALHEAEKHDIGFERTFAMPDGYHFCSLCGSVAKDPQHYTTIAHEADCPYRVLGGAS